MPETSLLSQSCSKSSCRGVGDDMQLFKQRYGFRTGYFYHFSKLSWKLQIRKCNKSNGLSIFE